MRIVSEADNSCADFGAIAPGHCFSHSGNTYMRMQVIDSDNLNATNAVRLTDGYPGRFNMTTRVRKIEAFVTVEKNK